jgi:hypothetical protein
VSRAGSLMLVAWFCVATAPALGQVDRQVVYWPLVTDGTEYRRVSYPLEAGSLVVLADTEIVIEARLAPVSYWPISREYLPDLSGEPELLRGSVEIVDGSGTISILEPEPYVLWYPGGAAAGPSELVHGETAKTFYEDYVQKARSAADRLKEYQRVVAEHRRMVEAWIQMAAERRGQNMPPPPPELDLQAPEVFQAFATEPREAFIVSFPAGSYEVQFRGADGNIVPGSGRKLVSFGPLDQGIGYVLRPENRWTQPVVSFAPDEIIYTTGGTDLFFQPVPVVEYPAQLFTRLFRPQSIEAADPSLTLWVPGKENDGGNESAALALWQGDSRGEALPRNGYRVNQLAGSGRGYTIDEFLPNAGASLHPDFTAMRLEPNRAVTQVSLVRGTEGNQVKASERAVKLVSPPAEPLLFLPALLPLALGVALRAGSRSRKKLVTG